MNIRVPAPQLSAFEYVICNLNINIYPFFYFLVLCLKVSDVLWILVRQLYIFSSLGSLSANTSIMPELPSHYSGYLFPVSPTNGIALSSQCFILYCYYNVFYFCYHDSILLRHMLFKVLFTSKKEKKNQLVCLLPFVLETYYNFTLLQRFV